MESIFPEEAFSAGAASRISATLKYGWRFSHSFSTAVIGMSFDDGNWDEVRVPHDWAIAGPFDREHDIQRTMIIEDGEKVVTEHTGRTGALPHAGTGVYRKKFFLPLAAEGKRLRVEFDGVMSRSTVYMNGRVVGSWPYGYASFHFDVTEYARFGEENFLVVRVENPPNASRWYPGAGIYRNVRLVLTNPVQVAPWGIYITTPEITDAKATVRIQTDVQNASDQLVAMALVTEIFNAKGKRVARATTQRKFTTEKSFDQKLYVRKPLRWDIDSPQLYKAVSRVVIDGKTVDECETVFGIREIRFDANQGFFLNGRNLKFKGVCMHHDLGALGSAVSHRALERQLEILKEMGCNAIRTSHNPPTPELLALCDSMGFLVIDEAFDEWTVAKLENGYHRLFPEWAERDLSAMIRRDRNHPCVIMWSIGNEIGEMRRKDGYLVTRFLHEICHRIDPTRPTTAGFSDSDQSLENHLPEEVDVPGWNYKPHRYREYHEAHPAWPTYGSETASCIGSRGEYFFPVVEERNPIRENLQVSAYGVSAPPWAYASEYEFAAQDAFPFIMGDFVWTGFDYLGEPTPYKQHWPSRSSYFGIVDLAGIPKDTYYLYRSRWASQKETLHLLPHWTWPGREGEITPVHCFTNYPAAELFLNGRSLGIRRKEPAGLREGESVPDPRQVQGMALLMPRYRLIWDDVRYEPGTLRVVALNEIGQALAEREIRTAGDPAKLDMTADRKQVKADGDDLIFATVRVLDGDGTLCPDATNVVHFDVQGPAEIVAVDNGDATSLEPFQANYRHAFHGMCVVIVRTLKDQPGEIKISASSEGLQGMDVVAVSN